MDQEPFVPADFVVPTSLQTKDVILEPLGPGHNEPDYAAWTSSVKHIRATPGWAASKWPDGRSIEDNLRDLQRHADDFAQRRGFTYTVLDPTSRDVVGCLYIYPDKDPAYQAEVLSWVRVSRAELDVPMWGAVSEWLAARWPFATVNYASCGSDAGASATP